MTEENRKLSFEFLLKCCLFKKRNWCTNCSSIKLDMKYVDFIHQAAADLKQKMKKCTHDEHK